MKANRKPKAAPANALNIDGRTGETEARAIARGVLQPTIQAAVTLRVVAADKFPDLPINDLVEELVDQSKTVSAGDMGRMEAMLTAQAHTLDALFHRLTRSGLANIGHNPETTERYMRLALRAQAQVRATAETLHEMKHPKPVAFVQQANIAHGPQQVNNGTDLPRAGESQKVPNELLEHSHGERLDGCAAGAPAAADKGVETVEAVHRPAHRKRKGRGKP